MAGGDQPVKVAIFSAKKYDREFLNAAKSWPANSDAPEAGASR